MTPARSHQPLERESFLRSEIVFGCLAVVFFLSALVIVLVTWVLSAEISRFLENGERTLVEIIGFREVSSGSAPQTRSVAIAQGAEPGSREMFASHILMDDGEVARLSVGLRLRVVTLPSRSLTFTSPGYDRYFVTSESLGRHAENPPSDWAIPSTVILLTLALITALASLGPRFRKDGRPDS